MEKKMISICGANCKECYFFTSKMCNGCNSHQGRVFHCPNGQECAIYHCCVTEHGFKDCLECEKIPCDIWEKTRDPKFSDKEFNSNILERLSILRNKNQ